MTQPFAPLHPPLAAVRAEPDSPLAAFDALESAVRSYCRSFPTVFATARGAVLTDEAGRGYVDFFSGAGALNYGHNPPRIKRRVMRYLAGDGVTHSLDMATSAKRDFLERLDEVVLRPRGLRYRVQFPGPTGTNAVEAALKLARKATGRTGVVCFANAYHGMTLGALAVTGNAAKRAAAGVPLPHAHFLPYDGDLGPGVDTMDLFEAMLRNPGSGCDRPAAVIVETVQAEGGVKAARPEWLRRLARLARERGVVLIVDDIQVGCGRTGTFFSWEAAGIEPDVVCLSKSISGMGLPMALVLIRPDLDVWRPGEHNGTFRGNNLAFVAATEALSYWEGGRMERMVGRRAARVGARLRVMADAYPRAGGVVRGRGLIQGIAFADPAVAGAVSAEAFARGLVVETAGPRDEVVKLLPPLTIPAALLDRGLDLLEASLAAVMRERGGERDAVTAA